MKRQWINDLCLCHHWSSINGRPGLHNQGSRTHRGQHGLSWQHHNGRVMDHLALAVQESSHSGRESSHHSGNQGNYHHHHHDQGDYDWRPPRNREHGQNLKMTPYDGKVAWQAYEIKLEHMATQYNWGRLRSLTSLLKLSKTRL